MTTVSTQNVREPKKSSQKPVLICWEIEHFNLGQYMIELLFKSAVGRETKERPSWGSKTLHCQFHVR